MAKATQSGMRGIEPALAETAVDTRRAIFGLPAGVPGILATSRAGEMAERLKAAVC
jgi:hypothetical protein